MILNMWAVWCSLEVSDPWTLEEFLKHHGFQPSKLRLYVLYTPSKFTYVEVGIIILIKLAHMHNLKCMLFHGFCGIMLTKTHNYIGANCVKLCITETH